MSSLHISIVLTLLTITLADNRTYYFTKSSYHLWCQENSLSNSLFLYADRTPLGIYRTSSIKSIGYRLLDDETNGLFEIKSKRVADFYFLILNITRPFDINREYQDVYRLRIEANIITTQDNQTEQAEIHLHVADSNDNDGVFDMDVYEQNFTQSVATEQSLIRFHASDADEIQHAQILYEVASSLNETFSLHPFTGELYLISRENLRSTYEFDVYAYDRYRKRFVDNTMKTKTHVKLNFQQDTPARKALETVTTIGNETIEFHERVSSFELKIDERKSFHLMNIHQPILTLTCNSTTDAAEIFLLNTSSSNCKHLFVYEQHIYLNRYLMEEYNLHLLVCFQHRLQCQSMNYRYLPWMDLNAYQFYFKPMDRIEIDEDLPVDSFIGRVQLESKQLYHPSLVITYRLLNDETNFQFYLHAQTGILRLAERLQARVYRLEIQANIHLFNRRYSMETTIDIHVREMNKYSPKFYNQSPRELFQLPYQFQAVDFDQNKQSNGRVTYRLANCSQPCPLQIDPSNGTLMVRYERLSMQREKVYYVQIIAFDWGQPISLESSLDVRVDLTSARLVRRDLGRTRAYSRRWKKKSTPAASSTVSSVPMTETSVSSRATVRSNTDTVQLNIGFRRNSTSYHLSEDTPMNTIVDRLTIEHNAFPLYIDDDADNLFFYTINDTSVPFVIDQTRKSLVLIDHLDRERQDRYVFEIDLKFKSIYSMKLQENYRCHKGNNDSIQFQYTRQYYQRMLVMIYVNDINDQLPICPQFHTEVRLNENELRTNLFRVQATDSDLGENGTIVYSLLDYTQYFSIHPSTGQIDCVKALDHEQMSSLELHVLASDQGTEPQLQSICTTLHLTIDDLNDNVPQFSSASYAFDLFSDMPRYAIFGQIYANDLDTHDRLTYAVDPNPYVTINHRTGHLRLKHNLHRLIDQILNVTVKVSDGLHTNQTSIHVHVKSFVDAQQPILLAEPAYALTINESLGVGSTVTNIYRRAQLITSTIDFIEIMTDDRPSPFSIDSQGYIRLTQSLIGLSKSSYWLSIRLTRYRAHPPHSFVHVHVSIRQENFYLPQCVDIYQTAKVYDYATQHPFARVEGISLNKNAILQYALAADNDDDGQANEKIFAIDKRTGFVSLLPAIQSHRRYKSDYLLTVKAMDNQYKLAVNCYVKIQLIRRRQLVPKFIYAPMYHIELPEIDRQSGRLRQRLFQIIALLDNQVYDRKLEIRYRITDANQHFIINRQTGYVAAKQPLNVHATYEFKVEAFTVAHRDEILSDGNDNDDDETSNRGKWRVVSSRIILPVKLRTIPMITMDKSSLSTIDSTINIDLLTSTEVGSTILQLGMNNRLNNNQTQWFIMIGHVRHTRYFHVDFQTGQLILIRPIEELANQTTIIELRINVTQDWTNMNTIKVLVRLITNPQPLVKFSQTDYFSSVSKNIPIGVEIARLTIDNGSDDCTYSIDAVERIKSTDLFRINPYSGSITVGRSLEDSVRQTHLLTILYRCEHNYHLAYTQLHVQILDEKNALNQTKKAYRFTQDNYLVIFETTLVKHRRKYLMDFYLTSHDEEATRVPSNPKIVQGDPLGLFSIDATNQSLVLLDESLSRSYAYPINLTIVDSSQGEPVNCTVTIFISNIGIHFPCSSNIEPSPYLFTYESLPSQSIDPLTGQKYHPYRFLIIHIFDPFTPVNGEASNMGECIIHSESIVSNSTSLKSLNFLIDNELYSGYINRSFGSSSYVYNQQQEPIQIKLQPLVNLTERFDLTYQLVNQSHTQYFQLDEYAGLMKYHAIERLRSKYSFLVMAKYRSFVTFARVNLLVDRNGHENVSVEQQALQSIYEFKVLTPFVNNSTIGLLNRTRKHFTILNEQIVAMMAMSPDGRLFVTNRTLILTNGNFYDFLVQDENLKIARIQIIVLAPTEPAVECRLSPFNQTDDKQLIGFIEVNSAASMCYDSTRSSFYLLNYNAWFVLDREHGLLRHRDESRLVDDELLLLIQIDGTRCLVTLDQHALRPSYMMVRAGSELYAEMNQHNDVRQSSGQWRSLNGTLIEFDLVANHAPVFSRKSYQFSLNLTHTNNRRLPIGWLSAQPYNTNRSHLVYQFTHPHKHFRIHIDEGLLEYLPNEYFNSTQEHLQVIVRDLIYEQSTTVNVSIVILQSQHGLFSSPIYHRTVSEILPPGAVIFQPNVSRTEKLEYSLREYDSNLFQIDSISGEITLLNHLAAPFYAFEIHASPFDDVSLLKLNVNEFNSHAPNFLHLPMNLSMSSSDRFVTKLTAYDLDFNDHARLQYYLLDHTTAFAIDSTKGLITRTNTSVNETSLQLQVAVTDGLYLTKNYLQVNLYNYSTHAPKFLSNEYFFSYDQSTEMLGRVAAYDADPNDQVSYQLHLEPTGMTIDRHSGWIRMKKGSLFQANVELFVSAIDLAEQQVYTKITLAYLIEPKFDANAYFVTLITSDLRIPSEILQLKLVDLFNQPLPSSQFRLENQTSLFEIKEDKLMLNDYLMFAKKYPLIIHATWKNFTLQTSVDVLVVEKSFSREKTSYEFNLEKNLLKENFSIEQFPASNGTRTILATPLTRNKCIENFYLHQHELVFRNYPILADVCLFEMQLTDNVSTYSSQIQIAFTDTSLKPKFSARTYQFNGRQADNAFRVFARSAHPIQYQLQDNPYGLTVNQTSGSLSFRYDRDRMNLVDRIQLQVHAVDQKTNMNESAMVEWLFDEQQQLNVPENSSALPSCSGVSMALPEHSLPGTVIQDISARNNVSNHYYILSGDEYGLFAINNLGQLYLTSSMLNRTTEDSFTLTMLIASSASSVSYCRTTVSIHRSPHWSTFICPPMPIQWAVEEESPLGTIIGTVTETLSIINNSSHLMQQLQYKLNHTQTDSQAFLLNSKTGIITSNARLDYEQKSFYSFPILIEPSHLNCSMSILVQLININDNPVAFDATSLVYTIAENNLVPLYVGRLRFVDIDQLVSSTYEFHLSHASSNVSIDRTTGSILLHTQLDRETQGSELTYAVMAIDHLTRENNLTGVLRIRIDDVNDHGPKFSTHIYSVNISKSLRPAAIVFQVNATSEDPVANGELTYSLIGPSEYFSVDGKTGIIRLKKYLPSTMTNATLNIEVVEEGIDLKDQAKVVVSVSNDDNVYFNVDERKSCRIEENKPLGTTICTVGKDSNDFIYELLDKNNLFDIVGNNGTMTNRKSFDFEIDPHEYDVTIMVKDRENQSIPLSTLNLTIYLGNVNDNHPKLLTSNLTTLLYFFYPSVNSVVYRIELIDQDQSNLTFAIVNSATSIYTLRSSFNTSELLLTEALFNDRDDNLVIRISEETGSSSSYTIDLHLHVIFLQRKIDLPKLTTQTIDGYINLQEKFSSMHLTSLSIENASNYPFVHFNLLPTEHFSIKQITSNQTDLYLNSIHQFAEQQKVRLLQFQIQLTAIATDQPMPNVHFDNQTMIYLPESTRSSLKSHPIDVHLWSIDREMLDRTLSLIINLQPASTYEQFIMDSLPLVRENLAQLIGVHLRHVHVYTFDRKSKDRIEMLVAIIRYPSRLRPPRYIHKKLLYNALKNRTHLFENIPNIKSVEKIVINQCQSTSCENNGRCTSHIKLFDNQYEHFSAQTYQRLIPKYEWNIKCLCLNHYYGQRCQFKQDYQSPCSSNPCSAMERCIEESSTLYTCQCIDEPCQSNEIILDSTLDCINVNSPTCRDSSNTLTFDGYSYVRMNATVNLTQHTNLSLTFRTQVAQGKLVKLMSIDDAQRQHILIVQIANGRVNLELDEKMLVEIHEITVNDGLWHTVYFSLDYSSTNDHYYYLLRLDHVFSNRVHIHLPMVSNQLRDFFIGNDFHGCLGNLTLNNQTVYLQKQQKDNRSSPLAIHSIEHIGTNEACQLAEMETRTLRQYTTKDDLCQLYHPCYHGGVCASHTGKQGVSFTCSCLKPRFAGRQCQRDLQPCESQPCLFDEQCIPLSSDRDNLSYSCISSLLALPMSTKNPLYIGLAVTCCTLILFLLLFISLILYCQQQRKEKKRRESFQHDKPMVSSPLLVQKSPTTNNNNSIESPMQTLLKLTHHGKQTIETMALVDSTQTQSAMNNFNDKASNPMQKSSQSIDKHPHQSHESLNHRRSDSKSYSTIGRMNIPPDNFLLHYNTIDYDNTRLPLVDLKSTDLFDFPTSPTKYFNGHNDDNATQFPARIDSLSNLTEKLAEQNDIELTQSSNDSSNNDQTLLTSPIGSGDRKRSFFNGGSTQNIRSSTSSLPKAPVYAKIMKTSAKTSNGGLSTIERLRLSGSPLRLLSSSPTYARTTSFLKANNNQPTNLVSNPLDDETVDSSSPMKTSKINGTSWKLNPRKLDSLKARRNSRQTDDEDDESNQNNTETSQLTTTTATPAATTTTTNRLRHASDSDLSREHTTGKKSTKLSSFFQTEV